MSDELKPCKRCGGKATCVIVDSEHEYDWDWFIQCKECHERTDAYSCIDNAIAAWNDRADDAQIAANDNLSAETVISADSREKLEADIKKYRWEHGETSGRVAEWLDRQAAITEQSLRGKIRTIRKQNKKYRKQIAELTAERDEWKLRFEGMCDTRDELEKECEFFTHDRDVWAEECDRAHALLAEKQHVCDVQRDSFAKMEREYRELQDVCGELERTLENLRGD